MRRSLPSFRLLVLCLSLLTTTACNQMAVDFSATGPAPLTASVGVSGPFSVEPAILRPEALPGSCGARSPFGLRLGITIRGGEDVILRSVRFEFEDRSGASALPVVVSIPSLSSPIPSGATIPSSSPVTIPGGAPLPATTPITVPGASPTTGVLVAAGSDRRFTYFLQFTCIVIPHGDLVVVIDSARGGGTFETTERRVPVE